MRTLGADRELFSSRGPALVVAIATTLLTLAPQLACACAVCFGGENSDWTSAFVLGTLVMLALPPAIIVTAVVAIYRSTKRHQAALAKAATEGGSGQ